MVIRNHYEKGRNHIDRWFFDKLGNIRKTIDSADYFQYPISDLKFIEAFMDGVLSKHFLIIVDDRPNGATHDRHNGATF